MTSTRPTATDTPHAGDDLLSMAEVAALIRVPVATLRYWRHLGTGPHSFRIGAASATGAPRSTSGSRTRPTLHRSSADHPGHPPAG
jgi:hypothetical protein